MIEGVDAGQGDGVEEASLDMRWPLSGQTNLPGGVQTMHPFRINGILCG